MRVGRGRAAAAGAAAGGGAGAAGSTTTVASAGTATGTDGRELSAGTSAGGGASRTTGGGGAAGGEATGGAAKGADGPLSRAPNHHHNRPPSSRAISSAATARGARDWGEGAAVTAATKGRSGAGAARDATLAAGATRRVRSSAISAGCVCAHDAGFCAPASSPPRRAPQPRQNLAASRFSVLHAVQTAAIRSPKHSL